MNVLCSTPNPKFKVGYDLRARAYSLYDSQYDKPNANFLIQDNFVFEDSLALEKFGYKNHVILRSLSTTDSFVMSNGCFNNLLLSGTHTQLGPYNKIVLTGKFTFRKIGRGVYLKAV